MCGIAGSLNARSGDVVVASLLEQLRHRGPDALLVRRAGQGVLGVCRLAVRGGTRELNPVTLRDSGRIVALNGEVYRWPDRAYERGAIPLTPHEEVLALRAADALGTAADGMYAIADLGAHGRDLVLRRDPFGMKPLFWCRNDGAVLFASETRALRSCALATPAFSQTAVDDVLAFGRVLGARSVYRSIQLVPRGTVLTFRSDGGADRPKRRVASPPTAGKQRSLRTALRASLEACVHTDRRLGLALSGGIDSSILAWELNDLGVEDLTTISVQIEGRNDGTDLGALGLPDGPWRQWTHVNVPVTADQYLDLLEESVRAMDAPHRMTSAPLYVALARGAARAGVVVLLSGEGPDELFFGYDSHRKFFESLHDGKEDPAHLMRCLEEFACPLGRRSLLGSVLGTSRLENSIRRFRRAYKDLSAQAAPDALRELEFDLSLEPLLLRADYCLMRNGIEGRMPFLHDSVPSLAVALTDRTAAGANGRKAALRAAWRGLIPERLVERPKTPFRAPWPEWRAEGRAAWVDRLLASGTDELERVGIRDLPREVTGAGAEAVALQFALCTMILWLRSLTC